MDPKLFAAAAQQGLNMNQQNNPNLMMNFQQQQQQQQQNQQQPNDINNFNPLAGTGLGNVPFHPANLGGAGAGGGMNFGQNDFGALDQTDLSNMNPFIQANPSLMGGMNVAAALQQPPNPRQTSHPASVYSPQNLMNLQGNNSPAALQAQFQNRNMFQGNGTMMPNTPQALMFQQQQQQQQAAMAMNRAKQSPSQSPALNNAHFAGNAMGSPVIGNSPHLAGSRMGSDYAASPMNPNVGSPVQNFQGNGISPSPQMARVIPSQANNRYMQHMNVQQQAMLQQQQQQQQQHTMNSASPSLQNPVIPSYGSPQHHPQPQPPFPPQQQQQQLPQDLMEDPSKNYSNANMNFVQQSPMQQHASPIPRQSATPGSSHSTPRQQHQQLESSTPHMSPAIAAAHAAAQTPTAKSTPTGALVSTTSPSPKPSNAPSETASPAAATTAPAASITATTDQKDASPQQPKQQITYIPKTRNVETYGGVDLKYFDKFEIKPPVPHLNELGVVDIQALIMSLKSGMKMELTNALNVLTVLTVQPQIHAQQQQQPPHLPLSQCDDLLDVLLDYLEEDILGTSSRFPTLHHDGAVSKEEQKTESQVLSDLTYTDLFDMSLDEMKSLIPQLEHSTSDVWISLRERCLCIFNILRNLSFMGENMEYLARHPRCVNLLASIADSARHVSVLDGRDTTGKEAWFVGIRRMDTLDFRKSILLIFSNISIYLVLRQEKTAAVFVELTHDFLVNGPNTYYSLLAIETWTKLTVNYDNRQLLHSLVSKPHIFDLIQEIWLELTAVIRRDFFSADGRVMHAMTSNQLATLELTIIGLYNVIAIVQVESLKQQLVQKNKSIGMMIIRLCITLAESGNPQFGLVTKRGMELIRSLVCGGDGIRRRSNRQQQQRPLEALSQYNVKKDDKSEEGDQPSISEVASRMLDMPVVREKLMLSMLKPTTDPEILRELSDIVSLIDEETTVN